MAVYVIKPRKPICNVAQLQKRLDRAMEETVVQGATFMRVYPPKPLLSTYVRTFMLAKSWGWEVQQRGKDLEGTIYSNSNVAPYNVYVQSEEMQSAVMKGYNWQTEVKMAEVIRPQFLERLELIMGSLG